MNPAQTRSLQADAAAQLVRAAMTASRGEANRYALADQALATYEKLIPEWDALGPPARADADRARADRLQALSARRRPRELVAAYRSEEHTSELQSRENLVCRHLLEKNKIPNP